MKDYMKDYIEWLHNECLILIGDGFDYTDIPHELDKEWDDQYWGTINRLYPTLSWEEAVGWLVREDRNRVPSELAEELYLEATTARGRADARRWMLDRNIT